MSDVWLSEARRLNLALLLNKGIDEVNAGFDYVTTLTDRGLEIVASRLRRAAAGTWRSIDDAPDDGSPVVGWDGGPVLVRWNNAFNWIDERGQVRHPTHFMPLTAPETKP